MSVRSRSIRTFTTTLLVALSLLAGRTAVAQPVDIPSTISYQGFLTDKGTGLPFNGNIDLTFRLYDVDVGGVELWTETHASVPVANGVFSVQLGSVTPFRDPTLTSDHLLFDRPYFVGIQVVGDPQEMSPRIALSSAPYAYSGPQTVEATVDCTAPDPANHESIQAVLDAAATGRRVVINVDGDCQESVTVSRAGVVIRGANLDNGGPEIQPPPHRIQGIVPGQGAVTVAGATDVVIDNLVLESTAPDADALVATDNAAVRVARSQLQFSRYGALARRGAMVHIDDSNVQGNADGGVLLTDGAHGRIENSYVEQGGPDRAAIGLYRADYLRLEGQNTIENFAVDGHALEAAHHANVSQDGGQTTFIGNVSAVDLSFVDIRHADIDGDVRATGQSRLIVRRTTPGGDTFPNPTGRALQASGGSEIRMLDDVTGRLGNLEITDGSTLYLGSTSNINADDVTVDRRSALRLDGPLSVNNAAVGGDSSLSVAGAASFYAMGNLDLADGGQLDLSGGAFANVQGNLQGGTSTRVSVDGMLTVTLDFNAGENSRVDIAEFANFTVNGSWSVYDFSTVRVGNNAIVNANLAFGAVSNANFSGSTINYNGDITLQDDVSRLRFGSSANISGSIFCGGRTVSFADQPFFTVGGFVDCQVVSDSVDLGVMVMSAGPDPVASGAMATFTNEITNIPPFGGADNVTVDVSLTGSSALGPAIVSATPTQGYCEPPGGDTVTCHLGFVPAMSTQTVTIVAIATGPGILQQDVSISTSQADYNPANDFTAAGVMVDP